MLFHLIKVIILVHRRRKGTSILREISTIADQCLYTCIRTQLTSNACDSLYLIFPKL